MKKMTTFFTILTIAVALAVWAPSAQANQGFMAQLSTDCAGTAETITCATCHGTGGFVPCIATNSCTPMQNDFLAGNNCFACADVTAGCGGGGPTCGDGTCDSGETAVNCPADCDTTTGPVCGDGACDAPENADNCSQDCSAPPTGTVQGCLFDPPASHTDDESGCKHAPGKNRPFTNGCAGCHGPDLRGLIAPSCYTCHGKEWDERAPSGGGGTMNGCRFNPPATHTDDESGCKHAPGKERPFTNGCTGCHGSMLTGPDTGGFAPSCFTCHGKEWDEGAPGTGGVRDHDDDSSDNDRDRDRRRRHTRGSRR